MGRKCNVNLCESASNRIEDQGVTFHKLPVNENFKLIWLTQCHMPLDARNRTVYVCSRHFRRVDFQAFKGTKYMLKTGAIPSMFAWGRTSDEELEKLALEATGVKDDSGVVIKNEDDEIINHANSPNNNVNSNVDIKSEFDDVSSEQTSDQSNSNNNTTDTGSRAKSKRLSAQNLLKRGWSKKLLGSREFTEKTTNKSHEIKKKDSPIKIKRETNGTKEIQYDLKTMNLVPGSRVEAKNFNDEWTTAKVVEVDNDENEILIQFESNKSDEWIPMNSSRLRPIQLAQDSSPNSSLRMYKEGERCMAKWTDSRKFPATVRRVLENDSYEVLFDDGYIKTLPGSFLSRVSKGKVYSSDSDGTPVQKRPLNKVENNLNTSQIPSEWCYRWEGDQPVGTPSFIDAADGIKKPSTIVHDPRLPEGWVKHIVKRNTTNYSGKWDVIIVHTATNRKFRSKKEIFTFLVGCGKPFNTDNFDFGLHRKRSKEIGWDTTPIKKKKLTHGNSLNNTSADGAIIKKTLTPKSEPTALHDQNSKTPELDSKDLADGFVFVGSLKVQIIDNLFRCPAPDCMKNFRKENLLQMHIKHYHPNLTQHFSSTPNVADLAYARTIRESSENEPVPKNRYSNTQFYEKVARIDNIHKRVKNSSESDTPLKPMHIKVEKVEEDKNDITQQPDVSIVKKEPVEDMKDKQETKISLYSESPLLEEALRVDNKNKTKHHVSFENELPFSRKYKEPPEVQKIPGGGIKRLLPIKRDDLTPTNDGLLQAKIEQDTEEAKIDKKLGLNYKRQRVETSAGLINKILKGSHKKGFTKRNARLMKEDQDFVNSSIQLEEELRKSSAITEHFITSENTASRVVDESRVFDQQQPVPEIPRVYINEDGEEIKLVRMRREEIINCACGHREEDGLMIQCELCLCWQHALCHGIQRERDVPDKYVCAICSNPKKPRKSRKYIHDQDWMLEGRLPSFFPNEPSSSSSQDNKTQTNLQEFTKCVHETTGNALELMPILKSLRAKLSMAMQTHHPKFYYWAKPWDKYSNSNNESSNSTKDLGMDNVKSNTEASPTLQALQRDLCNVVNESELLGAKIENEMNILKSRNMNNSGTSDMSSSARLVNSTMGNDVLLTPTGSNSLMSTETPSRGLNIDSETKVDDFAALAKNDVLDLSAILESNHVIPTDSELVSILEGDLKTESDLNSPMRGGKQDEDCKINMDLLSFMSSDDTKLLESAKSTTSLKSTSSGDLTDSQNLLAPLLASPGGTKFDLVSDKELENFAQTVGQEVLITNNAPVPEEAIDNEQCRWNLLRHICDYQTELEKRLDQFNIKLTQLLSCSEAPQSDVVKFDRDCSKLVKMMQKDLRTLGDTCTVMSVENTDPDNTKVFQNQESISNRSVTPTDMKRLW